MLVSRYVWITMLLGCWLTDSIWGLTAQLNYTDEDKVASVIVKKKPLDAEALKEANISNVGETAGAHVWKNTKPRFQRDLYDAMIPEKKVGPFLSIHPAPIKADAEGQEIIYSISKVSPGEYWGHFAIDEKTGVINVDKELDRKNAWTVNVVVMASLKNDSLKKTEATVIVTVANVNEPPLFSVKQYTAELFSDSPVNSPVVGVKASDPDDFEVLEYSLVKPSSMFGVAPSSGQVYVRSFLDQSGNVSLQVKVVDRHGLYDTTSVEVTIKNSESVTISLNQPHDVVKDEVVQMGEAIQKALGLNVTIISVTEDSYGETLVQLIATETSGNVVPAQDLTNELMNKKESVQSELAAVFGPDVNFDIIETYSNTTVIIIVVTVIAVLSIAAILAAVWTRRKRQREPKIFRSDSDNSFETRINF